MYRVWESGFEWGGLGQKARVRQAPARSSWGGRRPRASAPSTGPQPALQSCHPFSPARLTRRSASSACAWLKPISTICCTRAGSAAAPPRAPGRVAAAAATAAASCALFSVQLRSTDTTDCGVGGGMGCGRVGDLSGLQSCMGHRRPQHKPNQGQDGTHHCTATLAAPLNQQPTHLHGLVAVRGQHLRVAPQRQHRRQQHAPATQCEPTGAAGQLEHACAPSLGQQARPLQGAIKTDTAQHAAACRSMPHSRAAASPDAAHEGGCILGRLRALALCTSCGWLSGLGRGAGEGQQEAACSAPINNSARHTPPTGRLFLRGPAGCRKNKRETHLPPAPLLR